MKLNNVYRYYPEEMPYGSAVMYFKSENGIDFYDAIDKFTLKYKLCIEPDSGVIRSFSEDASNLYPSGYSIVEVDDLPDGFDIYGGWFFLDDKVQPLPGYYMDKAEGERQLRMSNAESIISDWRMELQLDIISDDDKASLVLWVKYMKLLKLMSFDDVLDKDGFEGIAWPVMPV